ncbi:hypothetical protein MNEG_5324, partial [Monoraphidium neglectum]
VRAAASEAHLFAPPRAPGRRALPGLPGLPAHARPRAAPLRRGGPGAPLAAVPLPAHRANAGL